MLPKHVQEEIDKITKQLIEKYKPQKIILFGSAAWAPEKFNNDSDLDFFIVKDDVPDGIRRGYEIELLMSPRNMPCDFIVAKKEEIRKQLSKEDPFVEEIINKGKVLYE